MPGTLLYNELQDAVNTCAMPLGQTSWPWTILSSSKVKMRAPRLPLVNDWFLATTLAFYIVVTAEVSSTTNKQSVSTVEYA